MFRRLAVFAALTAFALPLIGEAIAEPAQRSTTVKSGNSNTSDRMGGGGGTKAAGSANRMGGGGGGKGAVQLNPQPEPPGRTK